MAGSSARRRRWTTALALGMLGCCALAQTGCLHPPAPADPFAPPLVAVQPGTPVAAAPGPVAPGPIAPNAIAVQPAPALQPAPAAVVPVAPAPQAVAVPAPVPNPAAESGVMLSPAVLVAPVGANVVMVAGVFGPGHAPLLGQRVEWTLAAGGVGQITTVGSAPSGFFGFTASPAQKVDPLYAVNETFVRSLVVTHGAGTQLGDLTINRGQAWISVSSPNEGASYVTALAPELENWVSRQQTAVIHWVDAEWKAAPPAVGPAGSRHTFTTTITRRTTGEPLAGWHVRYEITGGPAAGFAPDGGQAVEIPTNDLGQANAEIVQPAPAPGTSSILIQVIRPAGIVPGGQRLVVGTAATEQTWTAPTAPRTALHISGPSQATIGSTASYRIDVSNPGDQAATNVIVSDPLPDGLSYLSSTPPAERSIGAAAAGADVAPAGGAANNLQWTVGTLQPGETRTIQLDVRVDHAGAINHCASVRTGEGLTGQDCITTTIRGGEVEIHLSGPDHAAVGDDVRFELEIINHGAAAAAGLVLTDRFDAGFTHPVSKSPIQREVESLRPGEVRKINITFKVVQPGHLCHTVDIAGPGGVHETTQACLDAANVAPPPKPALAVKITGSVASAHVGEAAQFVMEVKNTGDTRIAAFKITNSYDPQFLQPKEADSGFDPPSGPQLTWSIAGLDPGQSAQRKINFVCLAAGNQVCDRLTVTDSSGQTLADQACVAILPAEPPPAGGKLSITVAARTNPLNLGGTTSFVVTLNNVGPNPERKVALVVTVPEQMQYVESAQNPTKATVDGQIVRFDPILQLEPNQPVQFEIQVRANRAGTATLRAATTSQTTIQPVIGNAAITINAAQ